MSMLGLGTALFYPTLLAAIGDAVSAIDRATALRVYRFWRDSGFIAGALLAGAAADIFAFGAAIQVVAAITVASGVDQTDLGASANNSRARPHAASPRGSRVPTGCRIAEFPKINPGVHIGRLGVL